MKMLYKVNTNATVELIYVDFDERRVRIYNGLDGWQLEHSVYEVEDTSSWDDDFDFGDIVNALESDSPNFQIVEECEFEG